MQLVNASGLPQFLVGYNNTHKFKLQAGPVTVDIGTQSNHILTFINNNAESMRLTTNKALLIGSTTENAQLYAVSGSASRVGLRVDSAATPSVDIAQFTVNGSGGTSISSAGYVRGPDGASSTPTYAFSSYTNSGIYIQGKGGNGSVTIVSQGSPIIAFGASLNHPIIGSTTQYTWGDAVLASITALDTGLARAAAGIVRVTNASTGAGKLIVGSSSASTSAADLYIVGSSASLVPLRVDSAATPSVNVFQVSADNGTTTHFKVTSTGAPSSPGTGTTSERYGATTTATQTKSVSFGYNIANGGVNSVLIGADLTDTAGASFASNVLIGNTIDVKTGARNVMIRGRTFFSAGNDNTWINGNSGSPVGSNNVWIGSDVNTTANHTVLMGYASSISTTTTGSIGLGSGVSVTGSNQFVVGGSSYPSTDWYGGKGVTNATPTAYTINGTGGSGTNIAGADVYIRGGAPTGNAGAGSVALSTYVTGSSGTTLSTTSVRRLLINGTRKTLTDASTNLFEVALPTLKGCMGTIRFEIFATDATDVQVRSGIVHYNAVNKGGAYTTNIVVVDEQVAASTGTLTATWGITGGTDKVTIDVTPSGSLTESTYYILYTIENNSEQAITIL